MRRDVFWLKNFLFRHRAYNAYIEAKRFDTLSGSNKKEIEFNRLKNLVEYAYQHVPFYRNYYDEKGFAPNMLKSLADVQYIPVVEKKDIRTNLSEFLSEEYSLKMLTQSTTGGTTGQPLKLYKNPSTSVEVMGWRAFDWWGINPSDNVGILHRRTPVTTIGKLKNRLLWWPTKRAYFNASVINENQIDNFIDELLNQKTVWLQGYCSALEVVADYVLANDIQIPTLKMVWSTSSPLSYLTRNKFERAFNCDVMDQYGCCEMWNIALQKRGEPYLTICSDYVHVDIVQDDGTPCAVGEIGEVLITDLFSHPFPLIRYRLGDKSAIVTTADKSADGYEKMSFVKGRITDSLIMPSGARIDGAYLTTICDNYCDYIDSFQIHQTEDYSVTLKLKLKPGITKDSPAVKSVVNDLRSKIRGEVEFKVQFLDCIHGDGGKKRYVISDVALMKERLV